jgi:hypothetical protein
VAWSYASIAWAAYRGDALSGSNKALLYLMIFALCAVSRWTPRRALWMTTAYTVAVGAVGALILTRMALGQHAASLFTEGRLISPTGYLNANAALFMTTALLGVALAVRRELPLLLRGLLLAIACEGVQLALLAESRGWLFTLPLVLVVALVVLRERLRTGIAAIVPVIGALVPLHRLLHVYEVTTGAHPGASAFEDAAKTAGATSLVSCLVVLIAGTLVLVAEDRMKPREVRRSVVRAAGVAAAVLALAVAAVGAVAATHGHPTSGTASRTPPLATPRLPRTSPRQAASARTRGASRSMRSRRTRSVASGRTTSPTTTPCTAAPGSSSHGSTAGSCDCSRTRGSSAFSR